MALNSLNSVNLEQLALKGLIARDVLFSADVGVVRHIATSSDPGLRGGRAWRWSVYR